MGKVTDTIKSTLQGLQRIFYGVPGRRAKLPFAPAPAAPQGADVFGRQVRAPDREPLDNPPLKILRRSLELGKIYEKLVRVSQERDARYKDYEDMILDSVIAGAIEMMVDDATQYSREHHATVWVSSEDSKIRSAIEELFELIRAEERVFDWCFNGALYGDFFVQVIGQEGRGVLLVQDDWHPADVQRIDVNGALLGFRTPKTFVETSSGMVGDSEFWEPWEFVHCKIQASQRRRREVERERMAPMLRFEKNQYRLTTRYGVSVLDSVRRTYKQLQMVEQSLIIARMTRALLKYVYKIQVGEAQSVKEAVKIVQDMKNILTQDTGIELGSSFEQQFNPLSGSEDIFIPVFGEKGDVDVQTLGGEVDIRGIVDVDRLTNKLFGGLRTPKAYLGFEGDLPSSLGEGALLRLDIGYARRVKKLQRALIQMFTRLAQIHLAYKKLNPDPKGFSVEMDIISTAEEEERKSSLSSALGVAGDLNRLNQDMRLEMPVKKFAKKVYSAVLGLDSQFQEMIDEATEAPPEGAEMGPPPEGPPPGPGEGALEIPPEAEEEPTPEGPLAPPEVASTRRKRSGESLQENVKHSVMSSVTSQVRQSSDVRAETPRWDSGSNLKKSKLRRLEASKLKSVLEGAVALEEAERKAEREKKKELAGNLRAAAEEIELGVQQVREEAGCEG